MDVLPLIASTVGILGSGIGVAVGVYSVKKLRMEIRKQQNDKRSPSLIVQPTLDEVIKYGGNTEACRRAKDVERNIVHDLTPIMLFYLISCGFLPQMFEMPLSADDTLSERQMRTARLARLLLQLGGIALWISVALTILQVAQGWLRYFSLAAPLIPVLWAAFWKRVLNV